MTVQMLSTLSLNRMSCNPCLSAGRLWINDTDDTDDSEAMNKKFGAPNGRYLILKECF
jgi:hypothetical protein